MTYANSNDPIVIQLLRLVALLVMVASIAASMAIHNIRTISKEIYDYASALMQSIFLLM